MDVVRIPLSETNKFGGRKSDAATVTMLKESMAAVGLLNPITVSRATRHDGPSEIITYQVIAGRHRIQAARELGWSEIDAMIVDLDAPHAELCEIDENLIRAELSDAERAKAHGRRREIMEQLGLVQVHGGDRRSSEKNSHLKSYADSAADALNVHPSSVRTDLRRSEKIAPTVLDAIAGTLVDKGVHLDTLAKTPIAEQMAKAKEIEANHKETAAANRAADRTIKQLADNQWAQWILAHSDLNEIDSIIAMIEASSARGTISAIRRLIA